MDAMLSDMTEDELSQISEKGVAGYEAMTKLRRIRGEVSGDGEEKKARMTALEWAMQLVTTTTMTASH